MNLEDAFPEDPFEPTVKYAGTIQTPFAVPWAQGRIRLGAGFNTGRTQNDHLFLERSAFWDILDIPLQYRQCQSTSIKDESGTNIATSSENTSFAMSASVGGSFLGASGRGSYEKVVRDNKNVSNISVHAEHTCGQIEAMYMPKLDINAVRLLQTSNDPVHEFRKTYGDFFVAGYRVGAVNGTTISGHLANKAFFEAKQVQLKIKVVFATINKTLVDKVSQYGSNVGGLSVAAFDSLAALHSNFTARTPEEAVQAGAIASENKQRAMNIASRAADILYREFLLDHEGVVYQEMVDRLCDRGLVTELVLVPFASLREYQSLLSQRTHARFA